MYSSNDIAPLLGTWRHAAPWDSDDYLAEYEVALVDGAISVSGRDLQDGEAFVIDEIQWNGATLSFRSLMPSTGRVGINAFKVVRADVVEARFTFTVTEEMHRAAVQNQ